MMLLTAPLLSFWSAFDKLMAATAWTYMSTNDLVNSMLGIGFLLLMP